MGLLSQCLAAALTSKFDVVVSHSAYALIFLGGTKRVLEKGAMLAVNMGTGRDYLESHYIRRGVIDAEALLRTRHRFRLADDVQE